MALTAGRPGRLVVVAGTATEIGKTWVACGLASALRGDGRRVAARKPAQSFTPGEGPTDAEILGAATGERPDDVCPPHRWYEAAAAPFMAADMLGRPAVLLDDLVAELTWPDGVDVGLVEPAGGVRSPMTHDDADTVDLARAIGADRVVLVADAGLGTLNAVRLGLDALDGFAVTVFLNRYDDGADLHRRNRAWLDGRALVTTSIPALVAAAVPLT